MDLGPCCCPLAGGLCMEVSPLPLDMSKATLLSWELSARRCPSQGWQASPHPPVSSLTPSSLGLSVSCGLRASWWAVGAPTCLLPALAPLPCLELYKSILKVLSPCGATLIETNRMSNGGWWGSGLRVRRHLTRLVTRSTERETSSRLGTSQVPMPSQAWGTPDRQVKVVVGRGQSSHRFQQGQNQGSENFRSDLGGEQGDELQGVGLPPELREGPPPLPPPWRSRSVLTLGPSCSRSVAFCNQLGP